MRVNLKHIHCHRKRLSDGSIKEYYYHRRTRKRISGEPGTPEFLASYEASSRCDSKTVPGTLAALIEGFIGSTDFQGLGERTRADYLKHLQRISARFGSAPLSVFEDRRIRGDLKSWRGDLSKASPRQADMALGVLRRVLAFGFDTGELTQNHATGLGTVYRGDRSDRIWTQDDVRAFLAIAGPEMALALRLALDTGQRQGDLIRLTWTAFDGEAITLRQRKGRRRVYIPCTERLCAELRRTPRCAVTILTGVRGKPWTTDGFRTEWHKVAVRAGIQGRLTFHDLRGTAVTRLAELGCTTAEIAAITGHELQHVDRILEAYLARTKSLARSAIAKLEGRNGNKSVE